MRRVLLVSLTLMALFHVRVEAQSERDRAYIVEQTDVRQLEAISRKARLKAKTNAAKLDSFDSLIINSQGEIGYLSGLDALGNPVYDFDDNVSAAITSRVNRIWKGSEFDLSGCGIQIGHWEAGGLPLRSHREFGGRITYGEDEQHSSHGTHTAGTMIATGESAGARGMAPCATILAYRSANDIVEMADFAANGGIVSSHSYSRGNPENDIQIYGQYTSDAQELDELLYSAPYLTMSKSAGNTRNDGVNVDDGGYDILFTMGVAKNVLVVGAVDDVSQYTEPTAVRFYDPSSWGPTDDWRIKPDLSANGVEVFSADNRDNESYGIKSGTSMATPVVAGTVTLLQEYYHSLKGVYMKSATVRALLLNTTDELGEFDGPDFQNGWGLLNAERAAQVIRENEEEPAIHELSLTQDATYTTTISADGLSSLSLTIAWTDPAGSVVLGADVQQPVLVNDLDLRIAGNGQTYEPWVLSPNISSNNFDDPATKGDNFRDNVERIDVGLLPAGEYTISVSHKGTLVGGTQDFSLVVHKGGSLVVGLDDVVEKRVIFLYPNPSNGEDLKINIPEDYNAATYHLTVFDLQAQPVLTAEFDQKETSVNLSGLSPGVYMAKVRVGAHVLVQRLIIEP